MYPRTFLALSLALLAGLTSCDDSSNPSPPPVKTATELLMAQTWKVTDATETAGSQPVENIYADAPACFQDNLYKFQASGVFVLDEGATRCDPDDPQTRTGTWAQSNSGMTLTGIIDLATQPGINATLELSGTIESVSDTRLVLVDTDTTGGVTTVMRTTLTAQ